MAEDDPISDGTVAMRAPADCSEASVGVNRYVARDALVAVRPDDVAQMRSMGFQEVNHD